MKKIMKKAQSIVMKAKNVLANKIGETSVGTGIAILIAVVLGALMLTGLYYILGERVMPGLTQGIQDIINYQPPQ